MTARPPAFPWVYPYELDEAALRGGRDVPRPMVPLRFGGDLSVKDRGLVDSGSDHTLIAPYIGRLLGSDTAKHGEGFLLGVGGESQ